VAEGGTAADEAAGQAGGEPARKTDADAAERPASADKGSDREPADAADGDR
jgi:hypothetical protein